jgi:tRNA modification GTPase
LIAAELRRALDFVGELTGRTDNEDILGRVFQRFCIGK